MEEFDLGSQIRNERLKAGLTQRQLSERSGVSVSTISRYETNKVIPYLDTLDKISAVFGGTSASLFGIYDHFPSFEELQESDPEITQEQWFLEAYHYLDKEDQKKIMSLMEHLAEDAKLAIPEGSAVE